VTEVEAIDLLMRRKGEALAATSWEGFCTAGRGFMVSDMRNVGYFPASMAGLFHPPLRKRMQRLLTRYNPRTEIVVVLSVPLGARAMVAIGKRRPTLPPEQAFLTLAGTPALPPMELKRLPVTAAGAPANGA
jgi:hypothetical protein